MSDHIERACFNCGSLLHHEDDCPRDRLELLREALRGVPGPEDATPCGCTWKRVSNWHYRGAILNGDILTRHCAWHAWYATLPIEQQRIISRQQRNNITS